MNQIYLREARKDVDKTYVGFAPNGGSVKPVHIAGGHYAVSTANITEL